MNKVTYSNKFVNFETTQKLSVYHEKNIQTLSVSYIPENSNQNKNIQAIRSKVCHSSLRSTIITKKQQ
jgi:hypothetical protein